MTGFRSFSRKRSKFKHKGKSLTGKQYNRNCENVYYIITLCLHYWIKYRFRCKF